MLSTIQKRSVSQFGSDLLAAIDRAAGVEERHGAHLVTILPCGGGDGASTVLREVVHSAARAGRRVALVDMDLEHPRSQEIDGATIINLEELLEGDGDVGCPEGNLLWVKSSITDPNLMLELNGPLVTKTLNRLRPNFDHIFVDAPPVLLGNLSHLIAQRCDQVYLTVRQQFTPQSNVESAVSLLSSVGIGTTGLIYNDRRFLVPQGVYKMLFRGGN